MSEAYNNLGLALKEQGKLEEAIVVLIKALSIIPDYTEAYNYMGIALKEQGKIEEAIEALDKCVSIKPDHAEAYSNIGNILSNRGKLEEAIQARGNDENFTIVNISSRAARPNISPVGMVCTIS